jgi:hypothetical protein
MLGALKVLGRTFGLSGILVSLANVEMASSIGRGIRVALCI